MSDLSGILKAIAVLGNRVGDAESTASQLAQRTEELTAENQALKAQVEELEKNQRKPGKGR